MTKFCLCSTMKFIRYSRAILQLLGVPMPFKVFPYWARSKNMFLKSDEYVNWNFHGAIKSSIAVNFGVETADRLISITFKTHTRRKLGRSSRSDTTECFCGRICLRSQRPPYNFGIPNLLTMRPVVANQFAFRAKLIRALRGRVPPLADHERRTVRRLTIHEETVKIKHG